MWTWKLLVRFNSPPGTGCSLVLCLSLYFIFLKRGFFFRLFVVGNVSVFSRFFLSFSRE